MSNPSLTIRRTFAKHKEENPETMVSEKMIRRAVKSGELPAVWVGNRALISWQTFMKWLSGELNHEH